VQEVEEVVAMEVEVEVEVEVARLPSSPSGRQAK
jgi:hypothetical protein